MVEAAVNELGAKSCTIPKRTFGPFFLGELVGLRFIVWQDDGVCGVALHEVTWWRVGHHAPLIGAEEPGVVS